MLSKLGVSSCVLLVFFTFNFASANQPVLDHWNHGARHHVGVYHGTYRPFWGYNRAVTAWGDYLRGIGQMRLNTARAAYNLALARQERAKAYALERFIKSLTTDLRFLEKEIYKARSYQDKIYRSGKNLNSLIEGKASNTAIIAVRFFLRLLDGKALEALLMEKVEAFPLEDFEPTTKVRTRYNRETKKIEYYNVEFEAFKGGNILSLVDWLAKNPVNVKVNTKAHMTLIKLRTLLVDAGIKWYEGIEKKKYELQAKKSDLWSGRSSGLGSLPARVLP